MSATGLDVFDRTLQQTNIWLDEIMAELGPDRQIAWRVLGAVLRTVRNRVPLGLAVHLGEQLPILVRGIYYEQWHAPGEIHVSRSLEEFLEPIQKDLTGLRPINVQDATKAVFHVVSRHVDRGQVEKVRNALPGEVRRLWPESFLDEEPPVAAH